MLYPLIYLIKSKIIVKIIFVIVWLLAVGALITADIRGFSSLVSRLTLAIGILIFVSDIFVAYSIFYPKFKSRIFVCWLENIIWGMYMFGWTFLLLVVSDSSISLF